MATVAKHELLNIPQNVNLEQFAGNTFVKLDAFVVEWLDFVALGFLHTAELKTEAEDKSQGKGKVEL